MTTPTTRTTTIRALTLQRPWAALVAHAGKRVENRGWETSWRGTLLIHSGSAWDAGVETHRVALDAWARFAETVPPAWRPTSGVPYSGIVGPLRRGSDLWTPGGGIVAVATLTGIHHADDCHQDGRYCSPWAMPDQHHWTLADVHPVELVPCRGRLGLWRPDEQIVTAVLNALPTELTP